METQIHLDVNESRRQASQSIERKALVYRRVEGHSQYVPISVVTKRFADPMGADQARSRPRRLPRDHRSRDLSPEWVQELLQSTIHQLHREQIRSLERQIADDQRTIGELSTELAAVREELAQAKDGLMTLPDEDDRRVLVAPTSQRRLIKATIVKRTAGKPTRIESDW